MFGLQVKSLKIETNSYAKGFRDQNKRRREECAMFANKRSVAIRVKEVISS